MVLQLVALGMGGYLPELQVLPCSFNYRNGQGQIGQLETRISKMTSKSNAGKYVFIALTLTIGFWLWDTRKKGNNI